MPLQFDGSTGYAYQSARLVNSFPCWKLGYVTQPVGQDSFPFSQAQTLADRCIAFFLTGTSQRLAYHRSPGTNVSAFQVGAPFPSATVPKMAILQYTSESSRSMYWADGTVTTDTGVLADDIINHNSFVIGANRSNSVLDRFFNGSASEVHAGHGVLTSTERTNLFAKTLLPENASGWVGGWQMNSLTSIVPMGAAGALTIVGGVTNSTDVHPITRAVAATGVTMTGPTSGTTGVASTNFTVGVTPVGGTITGTVVVTPSDSAGGGTFTPTTISLTSAAPTSTFTYTPGSSGAKTVSVTNNGSLTNPSNITYTASSAAATAIVVSGPTTGTTGAASSNFTASANGVITGTVVITPAATGCTFTPTTVSISSGAPTATFTCTAAAAGAKTISFTNNGSLTNQASLTYTASAPAATGVTMTGPSGGVSGVASTNFSVGITPVGGTITGTVVVTPSSGGGGGTFSPTTVSLTSGSPTGTFTYTPASAGAKTISVTNNGSLANPSNLTYTATASSPTVAILLDGVTVALVHAQGGQPKVSTLHHIQFLSKTDLTAAPLANVDKTTNTNGTLTPWAQAGLTAGVTVCLRAIDATTGEEGYYDVTPT